VHVVAGPLVYQSRRGVLRDDDWRHDVAEQIDRQRQARAAESLHAHQVAQPRWPLVRAAHVLLERTEHRGDGRRLVREMQKQKQKQIQKTTTRG